MGASVSELARTLLDEGLRMTGHPGIIFRPGPAGRRPGLIGGPDVWEVARIFTGAQTGGEKAILRAAKLMDLSPEEARTALNYYADYRDEIDEWIRRVDEDADMAEAAWRRQRDLLEQ